jgi:hypothetical protein
MVTIAVRLSVQDIVATPGQAASLTLRQVVGIMAVGVRNIA